VYWIGEDFQPVIPSSDSKSEIAWPAIVNNTNPAPPKNRLVSNRCSQAGASIGNHQKKWTKTAIATIVSGKFYRAGRLDHQLMQTTMDVSTDRLFTVLRHGLAALSGNEALYVAVALYVTCALTWRGGCGMGVV
jgi:hypothetical protein